jgi:hypothetical protein
MPNLAELQIENSDSKIDLNCLKNSKTQKLSKALVDNLMVQFRISSYRP